MGTETLWLAIAWVLTWSVTIWAWRRFDVKAPSRTYDSAPPEAPCWSEQISTDGRLSYGRSGCYHAGLAEMEARARGGEFNTPY